MKSNVGYLVAFTVAMGLVVISVLTESMTLFGLGCVTGGWVGCGFFEDRRRERCASEPDDTTVTTSTSKPEPNHPTGTGSSGWQ